MRPSTTTRRADPVKKARARIAHRATAEMAEAVAAALPSSFQLRREGILMWQPLMESYLLTRVEALTGKAYAVPGTACRRAAALAPDAAAVAAEMAADLQLRCGADRPRLCLFWGVILRLDHLEGPPPADAAAFFSWCGLEACSRHVRSEFSNLGELRDLQAGRLHSGDARQLLDLPESGPLDPGAIRSAYRAQARHHHPDGGGDRLRFEQLSAARDRLLLEVAPNSYVVQGSW
jgi:hypothetical protein